MCRLAQDDYEPDYMDDGDCRGFAKTRGGELDEDGVDSTDEED